MHLQIAFFANINKNSKSYDIPKRGYISETKYLVPKLSEFKR